MLGERKSRSNRVGGLNSVREVRESKSHDAVALRVSRPRISALIPRTEQLRLEIQDATVQQINTEETTEYPIGEIQISIFPVPLKDRLAQQIVLEFYKDAFEKLKNFVRPTRLF